MKKIMIVIIVILIAIQFIPVERTNPPITGEINVPTNVSGILRTSCYDCHSNETKWPWYAYVAPVSFFVTDDVQEGRAHINFSEWHKYDVKKRGKKMEGILEVLEEGEMPLKSYIFVHPNAAMDEAKIKIIKEWVGNQSNMKNSDEPKLRYEDRD